MKAKAFLLILLAAILVLSGCVLFEPIQTEEPVAAAPVEEAPAPKKISPKINIDVAVDDDE